MGSQHIHLLMIEDNPGDAGLIREMLAESKGMSFELEWTETLSEGIERLTSGGIDVVLLDLALTDSTGLETLRRLRAASPWAPVVVVLSGLSDEEISFQAVQEGAQDYLIKGQVDSSLLVRSIRYALERGQEQEALRRAHVELENRVRERTAELVKANECLRDSKHLLQGILDNSTAMISVKDLQGQYMLVNHGYEKVFHANSESFVGKTVYDLLPPEHADRVRASDQRVLASGNVLEAEESIPHDDGLHTYIVIKSPLRDAEGKPYAVCCIATDITEWKRLQEQLRQSQKMEAIGRLAGGVAHDFNNLLGIIIVCGELLRNAVHDKALQVEQVQQILKAAERAAALTRKLLTFSRRQMPEQKMLDLNSVLRDLDKMLRTVVGEGIELVLQTDASPLLICSDAGQIEQVILNLVINARDAMPEGGRLILTTTDIALDEQMAYVGAKLRPGSYVQLTVSDTGSGIDTETQAHIFEPFFTTKEHGTGLGLSIVYGTIEQAGGTVVVESQPRKGTSFYIYLPKIASAIVPEPRLPASGSLRGTETLLVVEDYDEIRSVISKILRGNGYTVLTASTGRDALRLLERHQGRIDLMITDIVMPGMGGRELAQAMDSARPETRVLYMSGNAGTAVNEEEIALSGKDFMQKPFGLEELLRRVREVLDAPKGWRRSRSA
jgi:PAS domain S-box-containing protein